MFKIFVYENGAKNIDKEYTDYLIAPLPFGERLDETLDKMCLTLDSMPIESRHAFPPSTKLVAERWLNTTTQIEEDTFYMVVEHDDVQEYIGDTEICTHKIYFNEASAIAQGFIFDDISLTYELNDVTLDYKVSYSDNSLNPIKNNPAGGDDKINKVERHVEGSVVGASYKPDPIHLERNYRITIEETESLANIKLYNDNSTTQTIAFNIPRMWYNGVNATGGNWFHLFELHTWCNVYRQALKDNGTIDVTIPREMIISRESGPIAFENKKYNDAAGNPYYWTSDTQAGIYSILNTELADAKYVPAQFFTREGSTSSVLKNTYTKRVVVQSCNPAWANRKIAFEHKQGEKYEYTVELFYGNSNLPVVRDVAYSERREYMWEYLTSFKTTVTRYDSAWLTTNFKYSRYSAESQPLLYQSEKYNALDMVKKMILTSDTYIKQLNTAVLETPTAFYIDGDNTNRDMLNGWASVLNGTQINESIFTGMNLWQGFLEIGKYISAIPYIEFGKDDRFVVKFKQLGIGTPSEKLGQKISIFNSRNISDYHSAYVSYVQNLFNPENEVEEWLPVTSDSNDFLVYNDVAKFRTSKPILQVSYAALIYKNKEYNGLNGTQDSMFRLFEKSVYNIFLSDWHVSPSKGNTFYYNLGTCDIEGLNYVPPQNKNDISDGIVQPMALTKILRILADTNEDIQYNNVFLHIRYKTQDSVRCHIVRPDIGEFVKNTKLESYPHHDQFYGQQDKVIDSERYAQKLYGQLIRDGNWVYENTEYVELGEEKKTGELYMLETQNGSNRFEPYFVSAVDTEYYDDFANQKITYSKDFNRMSEICSPPSEVRVYPIANQNLIRREVFDEEFITITKENISGALPKYLCAEWGTFFKAWLFGEGKIKYPNFMNITFQADPDTKHISSSYGEQSIEKLFPLGVTFDSENKENHITSSDSVSCTIPLLHFPLYNSILFECDTEDNFQVKEYIDTTIDNTAAETNIDAYYGRQPFRYCDIFGRVDMMSYSLGYKNSFTVEEIRAMPKQQTLTNIVASVNNRVLIKDNREELSNNFQINLLHRDSDIILCKGIWWNKDSRVRLCALENKGNKFDNNILQNGLIIADNLDYTITTTFDKMIIAASFVGTYSDGAKYTLTGEQLANIQALLWYDYDQQIPYIIMNTTPDKNSVGFEKLYFVGGIQ